MRNSKLIRFGIKTSLCLAFCAGLAVPVFAQKKLNVVAVTVGDLGNPFFVQIAHGAQAAAKKINPSVKFQSESSGYDVNNQTNQMDNFIASGANLILLNAADSKGIAPAVLRAKAAGVTVVAVDVGAEGGVDATVTSNNKQAVLRSMLSISTIRESQRPVPNQLFTNVMAILTRSETS